MGFKKIVGIYKITSPAGGIYIGQTSNFRKRCRSYRTLHCRGQRKLLQSFLDYGFENHIIKLIHQCKDDELNSLEVHYIKLYGSVNSENGLNLRGGGCGITEEAKHKLSESRLGAKHHNYGKPLSKEWRDKIGKANKGTVKSKEWLRKLVESRKGWVMSEEQRRKVSEFHKGRTGKLCANSIPIVQYDLSGRLIREWDSASDAGRELKINQRNVSSVCRGERKSANGFVWKFKTLL